MGAALFGAGASGQGGVGAMGPTTANLYGPVGHYYYYYYYYYY